MLKVSYPLRRLKPTTSFLWMNRVLWPTQRTDNPLLAVREALARSDAFDAAFCFQCKPSKCAVAACPGIHTLATLALQRGYKQVQCLEVLGVSFDLSCDLSSPLRFSLQGLLRRLRLLRNLNPCLEVKIWSTRPCSGPAESHLLLRLTCLPCELR